MQKIKVNSAARYSKRRSRRENKETLLEKENKSTSFKRKRAGEQLWERFEIRKKMCFFHNIYLSFITQHDVCDR